MQETDGATIGRASKTASRSADPAGRVPSDAPGRVPALPPPPAARPPSGRQRTGSFYDVAILCSMEPTVFGQPHGVVDCRRNFQRSRLRRELPTRINALGGGRFLSAINLF